MIIRKRFDKRQKVHGTDTVGDSRTKQEFAKDADVNTLMYKYIKMGTIPNKEGEVLYQDVSNLPDFKGSMEVVIESKELFQKLDPKIRTRFQNNPQAMLDFLSKAENIDEAENLGLVKRREVVPPVTPPVVPTEEPTT